MFKPAMPATGNPAIVALRPGGCGMPGGFRAAAVPRRPLSGGTELSPGLLRVTSARRAEAVAQLIEEVRRVERAQGASLDGLHAIGDLLADLAEQLPLFPRDHLPPGPDGAVRYRLHEDADGRVALHAVLVPSGRVVSETHGSPAVLAVVRGLAEAVVTRPGGADAAPTAPEPLGPGEALVLRAGETLRLAGDAGPVLVLVLQGVAADRQASARRGVRPPAEPLPLHAAELMATLAAGEELLLLDLREEDAFLADGHPAFAVSVPLTCLKAMVGAIAPRLSTRIVLTDADGTLAQAGAALLARLGYRNVGALIGGAQGWTAAGFALSRDARGVWGPSDPSP